MRDQQIGGLLLWIPGSMMSVIGALLALRHWMRLSARGRLRGEQRAKARQTLAPAASAPARGQH
jgi:putative membrane protein